MLDEVRQAIRRLNGVRGFTVAAVLTLALGIGGTTAVFTVVHTVLLRPLPWPASDRLVDLSHTLEISGASRVDQSDAGHLFYRRHNRVFTDVGAWRATDVNLGSLGTGTRGDEGRAVRVTAARISAAVPAILRVAPVRGRGFVEGEDHPAAPPVALISASLWARRFARDPAILGQGVEIDGIRHEIVGIMPASFGFPTASTGIWLPIGIDSTKTESATFGLRGIARLRDGVTAEAATNDLTRLLPQLPEAFPGRLTVQAIEFTKMQAVATPLRDVIVGDIGRTLWVVLGGVAVVLLIACANVANLFLVRTDARQQELAIRRALGAGRAATARTLMIEAALIALVGGAIGLVLTAAAIGAVRSLEALIPVPRLDELRIDAQVLVVALGTSLLAALLVSLLPAVRTAGLALTAVLGESSRTATAGRARHRARHALVAAQVALALVLVAGAGLLARSAQRLRAVPLGFAPTSVHTFRLALPAGRFPDAAATARFINRALDTIAALPGVSAAGVISKLPLTDGFRRDTALFVEERPLAQGEFPNLHQVSYASAGYFAALGIPLLEGRVFARTDPAILPLEVIVSRALADRYWPGAPARGKRVRLAPQGPWHTIVGVAGDVRGVALEQPPDEMIYLPLLTAPGNAVGGAAGPARYTPREIAFVVRATGDPSRLAVPIEVALRATDGSVPVYQSRPMTEVVARATARTSLTLALLGVASLVALALGAVGIYGVLSYVVSLRGREIAVRMALGAGPSDVRRMVARQAAAMALAGIAAGIAGALVVMRVLSALLFGVKPTDLPTLFSAAALLLVVALVAAWLPATRAARVNAAAALRS